MHVSLEDNGNNATESITKAAAAASGTTDNNINQTFDYPEVFLQHLDGGYMTCDRYFRIQKPKLEYVQQQQHHQQHQHNHKKYPPPRPSRFQIIPLNEKGEPIQIYEDDSRKTKPIAATTAATLSSSIKKMTTVQNRSEYVTWLTSIATNKQKVAILEVDDEYNTLQQRPTATRILSKLVRSQRPRRRYMSCRGEFTVACKPRAFAEYRHRIGSYEKFTVECVVAVAAGGGAERKDGGGGDRSSTTFSFRSHNGLRMHFNRRFWNYVSFCTKPKEYAAWIVEPVANGGGGEVTGAGWNDDCHSSNASTATTSSTTHTDDEDYVMIESNHTTPQTLCLLQNQQAQRHHHHPHNKSIIPLLKKDLKALMGTKTTHSNLCNISTNYIQSIPLIGISTGVHRILGGLHKTATGAESVTAALIGATVGIKAGVLCYPLDGGQVFITSLEHYNVVGKGGGTLVCEGVVQTVGGAFQIVDVVAPVSRVCRFVCNSTLEYTLRFLKKKKWCFAT